MTEEILMSIKRIIFDLDNTLIEWKEEYWNSINKTFEELNLPYADCTISKVKHAVDVYEDGRMETYNKELMQKTIENELGYKLPKESMNIWFNFCKNIFFSFISSNFNINCSRCWDIEALSYVS